MKLLVGAAAALGSACSADRAKEPKTDGAAGSSGGDDGSADDGGARPNEGSGYLVVDMLPPPSRCGGEIAQAVTVRGTLRPSKLGNDVVLLLPATSGGKVRVGDASQVRVGMGGKGDVAMKQIGDDIEISFLYDGTSREVDVNVPVICEEDVGIMDVIIDVDPDRQTPNAPLSTRAQAGYG
jgi:hypothetical protein